MKEHLKWQIGEDAVNAIADLTFFKNWCFPSPKDESRGCYPTYKKNDRIREVCL